jgi:ribosomal protein L7Ae-like RNA K-turn-binding protein
MIILRHYILFQNYLNGLALEALLRKEKIKYTIVPTPRELSISCGISIQYEKEDEQRIESLIVENSIKTLGFHSLEKTYANFY